MAKAQTNDPIEKEMINLMNLKPGESADFLHLTVYNVDLKSQGPFEKDPKHPEATYIHGINEPCRFKIGDDYYKESLKKAHYGVYAICHDADEDYSGIKALAIATIRPDGKSAYINLICNANHSDFYGNMYKVPFGEVMLLSLLSFLHTLGIQDIYNHASNIDLIKHYSRNGWLIDSVGHCDGDPIATHFATLTPDNATSYVQELEKDGKIKICPKKGYPMKLCKYNLNTIFGTILPVVQQKHKEALEGEINMDQICNFA